MAAAVPTEVIQSYVDGHENRTYLVNPVWKGLESCRRRTQGIWLRICWAIAATFAFIC